MKYKANKGILLKILFGIYTRCQQIDFLRYGKFECRKDILRPNWDQLQKMQNSKASVWESNPQPWIQAVAVSFGASSVYIQVVMLVALPVMPVAFFETFHNLFFVSLWYSPLNFLPLCSSVNIHP